jgi:hypothetical protein
VKHQLDKLAASQAPPTPQQPTAAGEKAATDTKSPAPHGTPSAMDVSKPEASVGSSADVTQPDAGVGAGAADEHHTEWSSTVQSGLFTSKLSLGRTVVAPDQRGQPLQPSHVHEAMRRLRALGHHPVDWTLLRGGPH